jgi:hypothetical protein
LHLRPCSPCRTSGFRQTGQARISSSSGVIMGRFYAIRGSRCSLFAFRHSPFAFRQGAFRFLLFDFR